ncbi:Uncharacterized protein Rs2_10135 [Raphanus sativus]|nr:Uncharacterized protein Rs2_10135 [Raphanus sativus]
MMPQIRCISTILLHVVEWSVATTCSAKAKDNLLTCLRLTMHPQIIPFLSNTNQKLPYKSKIVVRFQAAMQPAPDKAYLEPQRQAAQLQPMLYGAGDVEKDERYQRTTLQFAASLLHQIKALLISINRL